MKSLDALRLNQLQSILKKPRPFSERGAINIGTWFLCVTFIYIKNTNYISILNILGFSDAQTNVSFERVKTQAAFELQLQHVCSNMLLSRSVRTRSVHRFWWLVQTRLSWILIIQVWCKWIYLLTVHGICIQGSPSICMGNVFLVLMMTSLHWANRRPEARRPVRTWPMCRQFSRPITSIRRSPKSIEMKDSLVLSVANSLDYVTYPVWPRIDPPN